MLRQRRGGEDGGMRATEEEELKGAFLRDLLRKEIKSSLELEN